MKPDVAVTWPFSRRTTLGVARLLLSLAPCLAPQQIGVTPPACQIKSLHQCFTPGPPSNWAHHYRFVFQPCVGQTGRVTSEQMQLISADPRVMHGQAVIAGTRVPVSVILDCLAAGMDGNEIITEYPVITLAGIRAAAAYGAALAREELLPMPQSR
jgi:uncharacterized protein (DUF433 family)